jgi:hypothetical protein
MIQCTCIQTCTIRPTGSCGIHTHKRSKTCKPDVETNAKIGKSSISISHEKKEPVAISNNQSKDGKKKNDCLIYQSILCSCYWIYANHTLCIQNKIQTNNRETRAKTCLMTILIARNINPNQP